MIVLKDRVKETTSTSGSGTIVLDGAVAGFQDFSVIGSGNTTYYTIENGSDWEVGAGTYSNSSLTRDLLFDSSTGSLLNLSGTSTVFCTYPALKSTVKNSSGQIIANSGVVFGDSTIQTSVHRTYRNISSDDTLSNSDDVVFVNSSSGVTLELPSAVGIGGKEFMIKNIGSGSVTITSNDNVDGVGTHVLYYSYESRSIISNNTSWFIF